ncbi:AAA family ATPase [Desulfococcaceae bacterium HSG8]|nr:AAA family ATPase [Desulfococcaceae bacterium HSG8]
MINHLYMRNFRGIAEGKIEDFAKINLFVGPNNTGKSTILEALYLMTTADVPCFLASKEGEFTPVRISADTDLMGIQPMVRLWQRHCSPIRWQDGPGKWEDGRIRFINLPGPLDHYNLLEVEKEARTEFVAGQEEQLASFAVEVTKPLDGDTQEETKITGDEEKKEDMSAVIKDYFGHKAAAWKNPRYAFLWYPLFTYQMNGMAGWSVEGDLPAACRTLFYDFHSASQHLTRNFVVNRGFETRRWLKRMGDIMQAVFNLASGDDVPYITFTSLNMPETDIMGGYMEQGYKLLPIDMWGDGARHAFKIIAPLLSLTDDVSEEKPGVLLWEDPELFLNPAALERLVREIISLIRDKPIQMFVTTQSMEVVAAFTDMLRNGDIPETDLKAFRLRINHEGRQFVSKFKPRNLIAWLESGMDPRLWEQGKGTIKYSIGEEE